MFISKRWRMPKFVLGMIIFEFPLTIACLALTGIASPDLYRTKLWQEGGDHGFNSKPVTIIYAQVNHRPVDIPMVWSSFTTHFNLVVSVLSMFLLLTKLTMYITSTFWPIIALIVHTILVALWAVSIWAQTSPDTVDPRHQNFGPPWYISRGCDIASTNDLQNYCKQAKATFAVSVLSLIIFIMWMLIAAFSMRPTKEQKAARLSKMGLESPSEKKLQLSPEEEQWKHQWEMNQIPLTPGTVGGMKTPATPRTKAFNSLMGSYAPPPPNTASGPSDLPLRKD